MKNLHQSTVGVHFVIVVLLAAFLLIALFSTLTMARRERGTESQIQTSNSLTTFEPNGASGIGRDPS